MTVTVPMIVIVFRGFSVRLVGCLLGLLGFFGTLLLLGLVGKHPDMFWSEPPQTIGSADNIL